MGTNHFSSPRNTHRKIIKEKRQAETPRERTTEELALAAEERALQIASIISRKRENRALKRNNEQRTFYAAARPEIEAPAVTLDASEFGVSFDLPGEKPKDGKGETRNSGPTWER